MSALECRIVDGLERLDASHPVYALERQAVYPLGQDRFRIEHGSDYLRFFRRLGRAAYLTFYHENRLAGVIALVLREIPCAPGAPAERVVYVCDFKVAPEFRGGTVSGEILAEAGRWLSRSADRYYGVSMNAPGTEPGTMINRVVGIFHRAIGTTSGPELGIYSFSAENLARVLPTIERFEGRMGMLSLEGVKDLILESTGARMALMHLQYGPCADPAGHEKPVPGATHMLSTPKGSGLDTSLRQLGFFPSASATIFHRGMQGWDWSFILTSEI